MDIEEAYERHVDVVYRFFYIKSLDRDVAEDLTSQTFLVLVERMKNDAPPIRDTKKFVYGVMRNVWLMHLRKKYQRNEQAIEDIEDFAVYVEEEIEDYSQKTVKQRAEVYVNQLPERQKYIVTMRLLEERSIKDIAAVTGNDINYVKTTYKRGVRRLRELITSNDNAVLVRQEETV